MEQSEMVKEMLQSDRETKSSDPAFGFTSAFWDNSTFVSPGLTKREYFAAMAMQGIASQFVDIYDDRAETTHISAASISVLFADALIEALNK